MTTGSVQEAQIFVAVLGASNYIYCEAVWSQKLPDWIGSNVRMLEDFGGVPQEIVCDNLRSAVTVANRYNPTVNETYLDMARHYDVIINPARPYSPKDKPKAENGVLIIERWILYRIRKEKFTSLEQLNTKIRELRTDINSRRFKKLPGSRIESFLRIDKPALKPLPENRYEFKEFKKVRAGPDYHVECGDGYFYSVPYNLRGCELELVISANVIEVLHSGKRVASHGRLLMPGKQTEKSHMHPSHDYLESWDGGIDLQWAYEMGQNTHDLLQKHFDSLTRKGSGPKATGTLREAAKKYGPARLEAACERVLSMGATEIRHVVNILRNQLDLQSSPANQGREASFQHDNLRGPQNYH